MLDLIYYSRFQQEKGMKFIKEKMAVKKIKILHPDFAYSLLIIYLQFQEALICFRFIGSFSTAIVFVIQAI